MKKIIRYSAYVAASIDGRIAKNATSGTDWTSAADWKFFQKSLAEADAVIAGYNTFKVAETRLKKRNTIVLTSKVRALRTEGRVTFLNPQKTDIKKFLEGQRYARIAIVGGARTYDFCLRHHMLDELFLTVEPYVFTRGIPMFAGKEFTTYRFRLVSVRKLNAEGTILLKYKNES